LTENGQNSGEWLFEVATPLGLSVRTTAQYWDFIISVKHPVLQGRIELVIQTLKDPDVIRQSRSDPNVLLFYREGGGFTWVCAVVKDKAGIGFLISAYPTHKIKKGTIIWKK